MIRSNIWNETFKRLRNRLCRSGWLVWLKIQRSNATSRHLLGPCPLKDLSIPQPRYLLRDDSSDEMNLRLQWRTFIRSKAHTTSTSRSNSKEVVPLAVWNTYPRRRALWQSLNPTISSSIRACSRVALGGLWNQSSIWTMLQTVKFWLITKVK